MSREWVVCPFCEWKLPLPIAEDTPSSMENVKCPWCGGEAVREYFQPVTEEPEQ